MGVAVAAAKVGVAARCLVVVPAAVWGEELLEIAFAAVEAAGAAAFDTLLDLLLFSSPGGVEEVAVTLE